MLVRTQVLEGAGDLLSRARIKVIGMHNAWSKRHLPSRFVQGAQTLRMPMGRILKQP